MKTITKYVADDGTEYTNPDTALNNDSTTVAVALIMDMYLLPKHHSGSEGYIQQNLADVHRAKDRLLQLAEVWMPSYSNIFAEVGNGTRHQSHASRIISEISVKALWQAWNRIDCIDEHGREWGQLYYRNNPSEAQQVCLNK